MRVFVIINILMNAEENYNSSAKGSLKTRVRICATHEVNV